MTDDHTPTPERKPYPERDASEVLTGYLHPTTGEPLTRGAAIDLMDGDVHALRDFVVAGVEDWLATRDVDHLLSGVIALSQRLTLVTAPALIILRGHDIQQEQIDEATVEVTTPDFVPEGWA